MVYTKTRKVSTLVELRADGYQAAKKIEPLQSTVDNFIFTACPKGHGARRVRLRAQLRRAKDRLYHTAVECSRLESPPILQAVQDHLPRELRDMVYAELMDFENPSFDIWLEGSRYVLKTTNKPRSTFFHRTNMAASVVDRGQDPYYIDPSIVGKESALEILQLRYRRGQFNIHHDALISRVLNQDAWKQDIVPKRWLSRISIYMPEDIYQVEERKTLLRQRFDLLQQLTNTRARIQVIFPRKEMYWHSQIGPSRKGYECLLPTDPTIRQAMLATTERLSASNAGTEIDAAVHNENVHIIMEAIFPCLTALKARGHQIHLDDRISRWTWTAGEGSATFTDTWTNRRQFRKAKVREYMRRSPHQMYPSGRNLDAGEKAEMRAEGQMM